MLSFCNDYYFEFCDDIYSSSSYNDWVIDRSRDILEYDGWESVRAFLDDMPDNDYSFYRISEYDEVYSLDESDFVDTKEYVSRCLEEDGWFESDEDNEMDTNDETQDETQDNPVVPPILISDMCEIDIDLPEYKNEEECEECVEQQPELESEYFDEYYKNCENIKELII